MPCPPRPRVLVADDSLPLRRVIAAVLHDAGYQPLQAGDGRETLRLATRIPLDFVVLDWEMPHIHGARLLTALRSCRPALGVLIVSGGSVRIPPALAGPRLLRKPFSREQLLGALACLATHPPAAPARTVAPLSA